MGANPTQVQVHDVYGAYHASVCEIKKRKTVFIFYAIQHFLLKFFVTLTSKGFELFVFAKLYFFLNKNTGQYLLLSCFIHFMVVLYCDTKDVCLSTQQDAGPSINQSQQAP